jgi:creatinine amidohydrolase
VSGTAKQDGRPVVRWEELKPEEFHRLDMIKAGYICDTAAARSGGIVAPSQTYHIHETGFHGTWLTEVVGEVNPRLGALPPDVVMRTLLF